MRRSDRAPPRRRRRAVGARPTVGASLRTSVGLASRYAGLVAPGGRLILGGILAADADTVARTLDAAGFEVETRLIIDEWASLLLRRPLA